MSMGCIQYSNLGWAADVEVTSALCPLVGKPGEKSIKALSQRLRHNLRLRTRFTT
jgi:hypothetical protein